MLNQVTDQQHLDFIQYFITENIPERKVQFFRANFLFTYDRDESGYIMIKKFINEKLRLLFFFFLVNWKTIVRPGNIDFY